MGSLLIINANAVLSDKIKNTSVFIKDGKIFGIGHTGKADTVLDIKGNYLLPGFVDVHVHGGGGADFMDATPDAFETVVKTHLKHGTTTLLPTAMSASENDLADFLNAFKDFKKTGIYSDIAPGVHLEGPYFSGANAKSTGAQPCDVLRFPDEAEMDRLMGIAGGNIVRWDAAPELPGAEMFAKKCIENGILPAVAHSAATSEETQNGFENGFAHITHFYNAVTTYRKEGQKVLAGVVEAAYLNDDITVELICDGKHIPRDIVRLALKIKGADKVSAITDGMRISGTNMKTGKLGGLKCGTDVIVDDGVAKLPDMSSFAGSIATMDVCLKTLCKDYEIDIPTASKMLSFAPAKLIGASKIGKIEKGYNADLVIADKNFEVSGVIKKGISVR